MITIKLDDYVGSFAEDKDIAKGIREKTINPALSKGEEVTLNFLGVTLATQSFIHALISDLIRTRGADVLDSLIFENCNEAIEALVNVVCDYMQDDIEENG
ncbi:STAS-like domain-containing protein [Prosthecochloris sp. SCSIO W1101]|uniref:STAS-like domain-containing protein n=1 Tax=Prosthecochloris sp. SCSIO W1101 TaxID=2992242 RepID=UPI00223DB117|nr:STAS-like domain-containing protein [Prosthecochloris sp. SCSIO W1101]UZJ40783.1 STAS-like domain-containing protein [Prosthecochloris sp. SCSIO W1101]